MNSFLDLLTWNKYFHYVSLNAIFQVYPGDFVYYIVFFHSSADTSPYSTPPQPVTERANEWTNQEETGHHTPECHLGRYCIWTGGFGLEWSSAWKLETVCPAFLLTVIFLFLLPVIHGFPYCVFICPGQAEEVFSYMAGDFMRPVVDIVDQLLTTGVNVTVYNGQLDLIVDTMGNLLSIL